MEMTSLNISLPKALKQYIEAEVAGGSYSTPSEYVRDLVREHRRRRALERLETELLEGLSSGPPIEANQKYWMKKRKALVARHKPRKAAD